MRSTLSLGSLRPARTLSKEPRERPHPIGEQVGGLARALSACELQFTRAGTAAESSSLRVPPMSEVEEGIGDPGASTAPANVVALASTSQRATALERRIEIGVSAERQNSNRTAFPSNAVTTTKYEPWNLVPKNLWEQFHRVANIWFLIVSIFQMLPLDLSPTNKFATLLPLSVVLFITFCKDAWEDQLRRRDDRRVNSQVCMVVDEQGGQSRPVRWKDVTVGAFLRIKRDEPIPADVVLLACANEDGVAYVDTAQLDGETSLKPKFALEETMRITETRELLALTGHLNTEPPNQLVQSFSGTLFLQGFPRGVPIDAKSFLLRGSTLRNTAWVYGVVVFTGYDTKLVQNLRKTPSKRSRVEVTANMLLLLIFGILLVAAAACAILRASYVQGSAANAARIRWSWPEQDPLRDNNLLAFFTFLIGYNNLIPISLYVTCDLARTLQGIRMELDSSMYHAGTDSTCRVRNSGLNEDLGQVEFVLTDKTGTLTENRMEFKACSIGGKIYGCWDENDGPTDHIVNIPPAYICTPLNPAIYQRAVKGDASARPSPLSPASPACGCHWQGGDAGCHPPSPPGVAPSLPLGAGGRRHSHKRNTGGQSVSMTLDGGMRFTFQSLSALPLDDAMVDQFFMCLVTCHTAIVEKVAPPPAGRSVDSRACTLSPASTCSCAASSVSSPRSPGLGCSSAGLSSGGEASGTLPHPMSACGDAAPAPPAQPWVPTVVVTDATLAAAAAAAAKARSTQEAAVEGAPSEACTTGSPRSESAGTSALPLSTVAAAVAAASAHGANFYLSPAPSTPCKQRETFEELSHEAMSCAFRSSSPDEEALLAAARDYGYFFRKKVASRLVINVRGRDKYYQVLICNEFSSERKRMSVLVQRLDPQEIGFKTLHTLDLDALQNAQGGSLTFEADGEDCDSSDFDGVSDHPAVLYAKGADNVMLERLAAGDGNQERTRRHMQEFASQGLRTLICAKREMSPDEVAHFVKRMHEAKGAFMNRDAMMEAVANEMERDMTLLGVTAVEDRIQQGVPETVNTLLRGGVKVWMLTGDNMETAINIAVACKLIEPSMVLYKLDMSNDEVGPDSILRQLNDYYSKISQQLCQERKPGDFKYCLVIHGKALYTILEEEQAMLRQLFLAIACSSASVVACRLAPAQKAALVKLVRERVAGDPLTLAIGDGGNDVSMIQEAHVGVGILGVEGRQAANAADYTIGQFRFLQTMMFVHGRWNLRRISTVIGYSFYKNFLLVLPLAFYAPYSGFSGTTLYESYLLTTFNLAFTSLPVLILAIFDVDVSARTALLVPSLYQLGIQRRYFNSWTLLGWIARGVLHALITFCVMHMVYDDWPSGQTMADQLVMGSWAYGACVCVANAILLLHTKAWMDWGVLILLGSVLFFLPALGLYSDGDFFLASMFEPHMVGVASCLFGHVRSWLGLVLVAAACVLSDLAVIFSRRLTTPDVSDLLQEVESGHLCGLEKLMGSAWATDIAQNRATVEDCLRQLPAPAPKVYRLRPEGRVGLKPIRRSRTSGSHQRTRPDREPKGGGKAKMHAVVPGPQEPSCDCHLMSPDSVITYPETYLERFWYWLLDIGANLWRRQWCEMTVTELAGGLGQDRQEVSKHFKSALRSSVTIRFEEGGRESRRTSFNKEGESRRSLTGFNGMGESTTGRGSSTSVIGHERSDADAAPSASSELGHVRSSLTSSQDVVQVLMYSLATLRFLSPAQEVAFRQFLSKQAARLFGLCIYSFMFASFVWLLYAYLANRQAKVLQLVLCIGCVPVSLVACCFLRWTAFELRAEPWIVAIVLVGILCKHGYDIAAREDGLLFNSYFPVFIIAGLRVRFTYVMLLLGFHMVALLFRYWILANVLMSDWMEEGLVLDGEGLPAEYFVLMVGITCLSLHYAYVLEKNMRKDFYVIDSIWRSKNQALEIIRGMFPQEVVDHVLLKVRKEGPTGSALRRLQEDRGIVTVLFCDIYDFDGITQKLQPMELVQLLDLVWMLFDRICDRHGTVKIETVGKTYMAAAMPEDACNATPEENAKDALAAVLTAIGMLGLVAKRFTGIGAITHLDIRLGAHTGRALSGVVGSTKPQFALFGDTVNTASRMQSTGKQGCLHVSGSTHALLKGDMRFEWQARKTEVKGKGLMDTYLLTRYHPDPQPRHQRQNTRNGSIPSTASQPSAAPSYCAPDSPSFVGGAGAPPSSASSPPTTMAERQPGTLPERLRNSISSPPVLEAPFASSREVEPLASISFNANGERLELEGVEELVQMHRDLTHISTERQQIQHKISKLMVEDDNRGRPRPTRASSMERLTSTARLVPRWCRQFCAAVTTVQPWMRPATLVSQSVSFGAFWVFYSVESLCLVFGAQIVAENRAGALGLRLGFMAPGLLASLLLHALGRRQPVGLIARLVAPATLENILTVGVFIGFLCAFVSDVLFLKSAKNNRAYWVAFEGFFFITVLMHLCRQSPKGGLQMALWLVVVVCILCEIGNSAKRSNIRDELLLEVVGGAAFLSMTHIMGIFYDPRRTSVNHRNVCEEHERVSELLDSMLPKEVLAEMKSGSMSLAYSFEDMTLLFADIVGFTRYCAEHTAEQAVHLVTRLFAEFDEQAKRLGIYKVCTIGDAYVVVNEPQILQSTTDKFSDCENVLAMAKHMLQTISRVRVEVNHMDLDMRIGLHVGRFVGGVIGTKRLRFDVWGEDVLIGNNVESHGVAGQICVSQSAKEVLEQSSPDMEFEFNKDMTLKTGRVVRTYICRPSCGTFKSEATSLE